MKLLFVVRNREFPYSVCAPTSTEQPFSSGLYNSVKFVVRMLQDRGVDAILESAIDNNCLDRLITLHRPTHVVLEALWVVPSKIRLLKLLHPDVRWVIRLHSEVPFIANEGIAIEWLDEYQELGVEIVANSRRLARDLENVLSDEVDFTPNYYPLPHFLTSSQKTKPKRGQIIQIGCFGAIRPLKNHLAQAIAAIKYANSRGFHLHFHINGTRLEGGGEPILKNLQSLFKRTGHTLIEHVWHTHDQFRDVILSMDVVMQVSFTETYNIVAADAVSQLVPVVVSNEITFVACWFTADPTSTRDIVQKIGRAVQLGSVGARYNQSMLRADSNRSAATWMKWIDENSF
jgi:hypothetical protein